VLYLAPQFDEPFCRLTLAVCDGYPETPAYGGRYSTTVPHITVAQVTDELQLEPIAAEFARVAEGKLPICATASEIALMDTRAGRWQVRTAFALR
jgi:hypothetical protein